GSATLSQPPSHRNIPLSPRCPAHRHRRFSTHQGGQPGDGLAGNARESGVGVATVEPSAATRAPCNEGSISVIRFSRDRDGVGPSLFALDVQATGSPPAVRAVSSASEERAGLHTGQGMFPPLPSPQTGDSHPPALGGGGYAAPTQTHVVGDLPGPRPERSGR